MIPQNQEFALSAQQGGWSALPQYKEFLTFMKLFAQRWKNLHTVLMIVLGESVASSHLWKNSKHFGLLY